MQDTVSVIIPTWNRAHCVGAAVRSALIQTYPVLEVLVCDDGSTDNTEQVLFEIGDPRVRMIKGSRAGRPAVPRNRGIAEAKGNYVAFLDSDDVWLPAKLETQMKAISNQKLKISSSNAWQVIPGKGRITPYLGISSVELTLPVLLKTNYVICSSVIARRDLILQAGGFPEDENLKAIEDYALWLRLAARNSIAYVSEPLIEYTDDAANSIRIDAKENQQRENVMRNFYDWYMQSGLISHKREVKSALRAAMKNNGRSFFERLKL